MKEDQTCKFLLFLDMEMTKVIFSWLCICFILLRYSRGQKKKGELARELALGFFVSLFLRFMPF